MTATHGRPGDRAGRRAGARLTGLARLAMLATLTLSCAGEVARHAPVVVGAPAPAYEAQRQDGAPIALASLQGEVVLLNIWATWCKPCREEIPALQQLHARFGAQGLTVAGVSIDVDDDRARIRAFAEELGARYPIWYDPDDRVSTTFLAIGVPASYLVDRRGTLVWKHSGPVRADDPALLAALAAALDTAPAAPASGAASPAP